MSTGEQRYSVGSEALPTQRLFALVYDQLRASAQKLLSGERPGITLQATALVHEAYLKLNGPREIPWENRAHFYAAAAQAMRQVLIDHARARAGRASRAQARAAALEVSGLASDSAPVDPDGFLALVEALDRLENVDASASAVVRFRFFAGLSIAQTAAALGVSERTVKRDWAFARGWLREALEPAEGVD